ncbi:NAD-dependent epimerase/dehydratase family protein [Porphyrobacter sp. CACIAM 03H1]|uniref:NAD-dependent epimerase/dehydratase family protein n=1 Tax=Porphyrobacter sp. CACIAM 03H1 TaxID=2003315 RepID=UPI000B5A6178|nr:NAD-dependent epimerase/dehydratase family protein [Porphyrobacter sp. CACIAM 03H1]ASJ89770.1 NAD-dependent epimerase [Porphyrobacter sp. CACIAM 03H1]
MKVLLIGGCGFVGSHVADALLDQGLKVRVLDLKPEAYRPPLHNVEYVFGDFGDSNTLFEALAGVDAVVHLASTTVPGTANLDPVADIKGNLISTVRLLGLLRNTGCRKFVYLSSGGTVYGIPQHDTVPETHQLKPINSYGIVKVAIENYLHMEQMLHGLSHVVLRASNPYGPRQGRLGVQGIIGTSLWKVVQGEPIEIWGDGSVIRDFVHVRDLAKLCVKALISDATGCFNAGSGTGASVNEIVEKIARTLEMKGLEPMTVTHTPGRAYDVPRIVLDITRAKECLGWTPQISLEEGIAESFEWVRNQISNS